MDYDNIFSAFLGALFGFDASIYIYRISLLDNSKMNLIAAIVRMRDFRFATTDLDPIRDDVAVFKNTFADIYALFLIYRGNVFWNRGRVDRAWEIYQGTDAKGKHGIEDMVHFLSSRPRILHFAESEWEVYGENWNEIFIRIPKSKHCRGDTPTVTFIRPNEFLSCDSKYTYKVEKNGDIVICHCENRFMPPWMPISVKITK